MGVGDDYGADIDLTDDLPTSSDDDTTSTDLTPRPYNPRPPIRHRTDTTIAQNAVLPVIYGKVRTGAIVRYDKVINGRSLLVYRICWGPIQSISNIKIDGKTMAQLSLTLGVDYNVYLGTTTQTIDPIMDSWDSNWIGGAPGVAYVVVNFKKATSDLAVPNVYQFQCDVEGMLLYDPSQDPTLATRYYRPLPSLALADYLASKRYGCARPLSRVYSSPELLESITWNGTDLGSGRLRHTIGIKIDDSKQSSEWIEILRGSGQLLRPVWNGGQWHISPDKPRSASTIAFTDQGVDANIKEVSPLKVKGTSEIITRARVSYVDQTNGFRSDWAEDEDDDISSDSEDLVIREFDYQIPNYDQAKRLAKFFRRRSMVDKGGRIRVLAEGEQVLPGLVCPITVLQWNWAGVDSFIKKVAPDGLGWWFDIEPYVDVWSDTEETNTTFIPPASPSPYDAPEPPTNLVLRRERYEPGRWRITISWTASTTRFALIYRVTAQLPGSSEWILAEVSSATGPVYLDLDDVTKTYTVRVYAIVAATNIISTSALTGTTSLTDATSASTTGAETTTDETPTTLETIAIDASRTYWVETVVRARRTGGAAGTADDGAIFIVKQAFETISSVVTPIGDATYEIFRDQEAWTADLVVSGADVLVQVTGAADNTIDWASSTTTMSVATQQSYAVASLATSVWVTGDQQLEM